MALPTVAGNIEGSGPFQSKLMNRDELVDWILRRLGAGLLKVELTCDHVIDAVDAACRWFAAKKGVFKLGEMQIQPGRVQYQLHNQVDIVLDVAFTQASTDMSVLFAPFLFLDEAIPTDLFYSPSSAGVYSTHTQLLQHVKMSKRIIGAEQDWEQRGRLLFVSPTPRQSGKAIIEFKSSVFNLHELPERDHYLVKQYAYAHAMRDLGFIRSKYSSFPGAEGDMSMNGDRLIDTAEGMIEKLNEEIILTGFPTKFAHG